ncbi:hypothetical protein N8996_03980 [Candidatus Poseidonia alphae]|nr:hypothetical protein [Candidatus Poseidonia alphae]
MFVNKAKHGTPWLETFLVYLDVRFGGACSTIGQHRRRACVAEGLFHRFSSADRPAYDSSGWIPELRNLCWTGY